jgi:hypothetical protein
MDPSGTPLAADAGSLASGRPVAPRAVALHSGGFWLLIMAGVCAVGFGVFVVSALGGMAGHGGPVGPDYGLLAVAAGALGVLGGMVALIGRLVLGRGSLGPAARISAAGCAPFVVFALAYPVVAGGGAAPAPVAWVVAALATALSLFGVVRATRAALARRAR